MELDHKIQVRVESINSGSLLTLNDFKSTHDSQEYESMCFVYEKKEQDAVQSVQLHYCINQRKILF